MEILLKADFLYKNDLRKIFHYKATLFQAFYFFGKKYLIG